MYWNLGAFYWEFCFGFSKYIASSTDGFEGPSADNNVSQSLKVHERLNS